ncbi:MAG TPA: UDP-N-acetylmuramoyl-tripeptide--D-alanyl-D-alanine ligase [Tepidisphaeraceae bacterium]
MTLRSIFTDTRQKAPAGLFIALRGDKFDGHQFLAAAAANGAIAALVEATSTTPIPGLQLIQVHNSRIAMGRLAQFVRQGLHGKVIAVAGSNGKTSTKHLIDAALESALKGTISPKSFNNDIGVPLSIFAADPAHDYLVLEIGTNHPGEIKTLADIALPDIAVITNCGEEHLEGLGDLAGVRRENAQIIAGLRPDGLLVVNGDDPDLLAAVSAFPGQRVTFGFGVSNDLFATQIICDESGVRFTLNDTGRTVFVPLLGKHTAANALAAIAVARKMGVPEDAIIAGLSHARGPDMRLQLKKIRGITLLNDAYNANPASMRAALATLAALPTQGNRIAILGDMRELGESAGRYHREIGELAATSKLDRLVCVGAEAQNIADAAEANGMRGAVQCFADAKSAASTVPAMLRKDDLVLLKASRSIGLEAVAKAIGA